MPVRHPIVGIPCDRRMLDDHAFHVVGEKYIEAVRLGSGAVPILIPSLEPPIAIADLIASVDGFLFTGAVSNVAPKHYGGHTPRPRTLLDEFRDATTLPLMRAAEEAGVPMLCICRGFQELNVAFGGTLHQHLHEVEGFADHRVGERKRNLDRAYGPVHDVEIAKSGVLARLLPGTDKFAVNSLHGQGIDRLAKPLTVEAKAPDGAIEAVSMKTAPAYLLGVQWHPEWKFAQNAVSRAIFASFGEAMASHAQPKRG
jgi:putative glutamine amidotransferase